MRNLNLVSRSPRSLCFKMATTFDQELRKVRWFSLDPLAMEAEIFFIKLFLAMKLNNSRAMRCFLDDWHRNSFSLRAVNLITVQYKNISLTRSPKLKYIYSPSFKCI